LEPELQVAADLLERVPRIDGVLEEFAVIRAVEIE
jgi:hypothetical protein